MCAQRPANPATSKAFSVSSSIQDAWSYTCTNTDTEQKRPPIGGSGPLQTHSTEHRHIHRPTRVTDSQEPGQRQPRRACHCHRQRPSWISETTVYVGIYSGIRWDTAGYSGIQRDIIKIYTLEHGCEARCCRLILFQVSELLAPTNALEHTDRASTAQVEFCRRSGTVVPGRWCMRQRATVHHQTVACTRADALDARPAITSPILPRKSHYDDACCMCSALRTGSR